MEIRKGKNCLVGHR